MSREASLRLISAQTCLRVFSAGGTVSLGWEPGGQAWASCVLLELGCSSPGTVISGRDGAEIAEGTCRVPGVLLLCVEQTAAYLLSSDLSAQSVQTPAWPGDSKARGTHSGRWQLSAPSAWVTIVSPGEAFLPLELRPQDQQSKAVGTGEEHSATGSGVAMPASSASLNVASISAESLRWFTVFIGRGSSGNFQVAFPP